MIKLKIMKNLINIISFITIVLFSNITSQAQVDLVASVDETPPFTIGQTFNYSIMSTGNPYNSLRIKLIYDPSIIQLNSLTPVYNFDFTPVNDTNTPGLIKYEAASLSGNITTDEVIFTIEFEVLDNNQTITINHNYDSADGTVVVNSGGNNVLGTANDITLSTLSVESKIFNDSSFTIYPNPVNDNLYIKVNTSTEVDDIKFYTIDGKLVLTHSNFDIQNNSILINSTNSLNNGLYLMTLTSISGEKATYKVVIEH